MYFLFAHCVVLHIHSNRRPDRSYFMNVFHFEAVLLSQALGNSLWHLAVDVCQLRVKIHTKKREEEEEEEEKHQFSKNECRQCNSCSLPPLSSISYSEWEFSITINRRMNERKNEKKKFFFFAVVCMCWCVSRTYRFSRSLYTLKLQW